MKGFFHIYNDSRSAPQSLITIARVKRSYTTSEVPTLCAVIQKGILISERVLVELGKANTELHSKDIIAQL